MNCDGVKGLCSGLGVFSDGCYQLSDDCCETLTTILEQLQEDDPVERSTRRQLSAAHIIQQDLVPLIIDIEDDPEVFQLGIRLLVSLTQPVECLHQSKNVDPKAQGQVDIPTWVWDVNSMLVEAKTACANVRFIKAVFTEIQKIVEDAGEYDLVESDCETINQCLLLIRNLLYIQDSAGQDCLSEIHMVFLRNLFQCRVDQVLLFLLNTKQKDFWGVTLVQLISLLYRDLVSEIFVRIEDLSSCGEESCDSSNCSHCEAAMDRSFPFDPNFCNSPTKIGSSDSSRNSSPDFTNNTISSSAESKTVILSEEQSRESKSSSPLSQCFRNSCQIEQTWEEPAGNDESVMYAKHKDTPNKIADKNCGAKDSVKKNSLGSMSSGTIKSSTVKSKLESASTEMRSDDSSSSLDELGSQLTEFTFNFLQNGFSSLVNVLKQSLMTDSDETTPQALDDSYFLWSVAFFLKFARRKEIEFKKIKDVFTADVFGFVVFEAVINGEDVLNSYKNNKQYTLSMRRLHLSVSALRELIKTVTFHRERGLDKDDLDYLEQLQKDLANMVDLRQVFLWLIRNYQPSCHSILFLRDVIVTNHYFLLLLEEWISRDLCEDKRVDMLGHVKQFAVNGVMQKYGYLLQNFVRNDHHVNNCVFTMMHHVAGDCLRPEALLQVDILKTFLQIWDTELPITQEMNDLMEYVIQKFLSTAEENPVSCAIQLFIDSQDSQEEMFTENAESPSGDSDWTEEEMDRVFMWYAELEGCPDVIDRITMMFSEIGIKKSKLEIGNHMFRMGWLNSDQLQMFLSTEKQVVGSPKLLEEEKKQKKCISVLEELARMEEEKVIPHCVDKLRDEGFEEQLAYLQSCFLEAAYVRIDGEFMEKKQQEEPVFRYFHTKGKDFPIIFYNDEQEKMGHNVYMLALQQQMGLHLEDMTGLIYPRIPHDLSVNELVSLAQMLGKVNQEYVKFDLAAVPDMISATTKDVFATKPVSEPQRRKSSLRKIPGVAWASLVNSFNKSESKMLLGATAMAVQGMDTE